MKCKVTYGDKTIRFMDLTAEQINKQEKLNARSKGNPYIKIEVL